MKTILYYQLLFFCCFFNSFDATSQKKYNVILIPVDDLSIAFDAYGNPDAQAPNFARLMQHGMLFRQAYCQYPLCNASRASLLSGQRPDKTGVINNETSIRTNLGDQYKFLPEYFHACGYRTEKFGKVTCEHEAEISWDYIYDSVRTNQEHVSLIPYWWIDTASKNESETPSGKYTNAIIQKIRRPVATPYFYALGLTTHNPFTPILASWNKTGDNLVKELLPVDIDGTLTNILGNGSSNIILPDTPPDDTADIPEIALKYLLNYPPDEVQRIRHAYYSEIIQMDVHLGVLLNELDSLQIWNNTIVVFFADHGLHMGEHDGLWLKLTLFEESLRVPFIICAPGKKKGICNSLVEMVDIYSTLAELCGLPAPPDLEGSSLVPLLENPDAKWKKAVFAQVKRRSGDHDTLMGRAVRTERYHYNSWGEYGEELYDIKTDSHEYTNLAGNPEYENILNKMRSLLAKGWQGSLPPVYTRRTYFKDADADNFGVQNDSIIAYFPPDNYVKKKGDCNDNNPNIHPGATERACNGTDDNCDGHVDENKPIPAITTLGSLDICETGSVILKTNAGNGFSYQWKRNGTDIPGATQRTYTATIRGKYKVVVTHISGCSNNSNETTVTSSCSAIALNNEILMPLTISSFEFSLYPNPSRGNIQVTYNSNATRIVQLKVIDIAGRVLFSKTEYPIKGNNIFRLNLSNLNSGMYSLELNNGMLPKQIKFLIGR